jgi:hypothetical protein
MMAPIGGGGATGVTCEGEQAREARNTPSFLKNRERGERITRADKSTKNPHGCTVHHSGERFESTWLTASGRGRCSPEAKGGRRASVWLLGGGGEVVRRAAIESSTRR